MCIAAGLERASGEGVKGNSLRNVGSLRGAFGVGVTFVFSLIFAYANFILLWKEVVATIF